jgi:hypothetical protein
VRVKSYRGGRQHGKPDTSRILYKKIRCGYCNHIMSYEKKSKGGVYSCLTPNYTGEYGCLCEKYAEQVIIDAVKNVVKAQITIMVEMERLCRNAGKSVKQSAKSIQVTVDQLDKDVDRLQSFKRQLYERYKGGGLDKEAYLYEREVVERELSERSAQLENLLSTSEKQRDDIDSAADFFAMFKKFQTDIEPTSEAINILVLSVSVYSRDRIEVKFAYQDKLNEALSAEAPLKQR